MMSINENYKNIRIYILRIVIKILTFLPEFRIKIKIIQHLNKIKYKPDVNLFDDHSFLSYLKMKKDGLEINIMSIKTLVIRGSNSDYGFYAPIWEDSYNLGLTSTDLYSTYHLYQKYRKELKNLDNVIFFVNIPSPGYSLIHTTERYRAVSYKYFFDIPYANKKMIKRKYEKKILKECKNVLPIAIDPNYRGYDKKTYYGTTISTIDRARTHLRENRREPNQLIWLKMLYQSICEDKRRLIIVIPPFRSDFKKELPYESILFEKFYSLGLEEAEFLNLYNSKLFTDEDFGDTDHLNEQGAIKLTQEIYEIFNSKNFI